MFLASVLTLLTPISAKGGYIVLSLCRFLIGLAHGAFWPAMVNFLHEFKLILLDLFCLTAILN
jgi:predicted MFS family arabinose efflux permease